MSGKILLSFVIPVYNAEQYLNECLDSIFDPLVDKNEYEVIAIDDGSTDGSPAILKTYGRHKNFRVITQENAGPGAARNAGIKAANGKYISFVDSDDYLLSGAVPKLLGFARDSDCDIVEFDNQTTDEAGNQIANFRTSPDRTPHYGKGHDICAKWYGDNRFICYSFIRIYKREFILDNSLSFPLRIYREDDIWSFKCFFFADTFRYYPALIYNYRRRKGSLSDWLNDRKTVLDLITLADLLSDFRNGIEPNEENQEYLAVLGDLIAYRLERAINTLYKLTGDDRRIIFRELAKRRNLLGLATSEKGRRMYRITRWLPARAAFRIYKVL